VTLTGTDATGAGLQLPSPCTWFQIHQGTPTGPIVPLGIGCPTVIVPVLPNGSFSFTWDQKDASGAFVPPGDYWFRTSAWDGGFTTLYVDWHCISIQPAGAPALSSSTPAKVGASLDLALSSPAHPGALYVAAASVTSNLPIPLPGKLTCLSPDGLFALSLVPTSTVFLNFQGALDGAGQATGLAVAVPAMPSLAYQSLKVQAVLVTPAGYTATNGLSFAIQP
jgi:hypothetical protein